MHAFFVFLIKKKYLLLLLIPLSFTCRRLSWNIFSLSKKTNSNNVLVLKHNKPPMFCNFHIFYNRQAKLGVYPQKRGEDLYF